MGLINKETKQWSARQWALLMGGSPVEAAQAFEQAIQPLDIRDKAREERWGRRFGALRPAERVPTLCMSEQRLREYLRGALSNDDSGIAPEFELERKALRSLALSKLWRESHLDMSDPDPRVNSMGRVRLGRALEWRHEWEQAPRWTRELKEAIHQLDPSSQDCAKALNPENQPKASGVWKMALAMSLAAGSLATIWIASDPKGGRLLEGVIGLALALIPMSPWALKAARRALSLRAGRKALKALGLQGWEKEKQAARERTRKDGLGEQWVDEQELSREQKAKLNEVRRRASEESWRESTFWRAQAQRESEALEEIQAMPVEKSEESRRKPKRI